MIRWRTKKIDVKEVEDKEEEEEQGEEEEKVPLTSLAGMEFHFLVWGAREYVGITPREGKKGKKKEEKKDERREVTWNDTFLLLLI